jgi:hypothetical protein
LHKEFKESTEELKKSIKDVFALAEAKSSQMVIDSKKALEDTKKECAKRQIVREKRDQELRKKLVEEGDLEALEAFDRDSKMLDKLLSR